ncbi:gap junction beta-5 protein [Heterodontus francisci]|uniref:gap junction beta-5 protein n=1 Tax=Heterodontus francisci TaxID=7792 RepID=UPI00355C6251
MAAYIAGFSRLASIAMGTLTGRQGMTLWYGLMGVRLVALFVADRPWSTLRADYICNGTLTPYCWAECFNAHFRFPMDVFWDFSYVLAVLPILCLYQLSPRVRTAKGAPPEGPPPGPTLAQAAKRPKGSCWRAWVAVSCALALAAIEGAFLWVLSRAQLPQVAPVSVLCVSSACSQTVDCMLYARSEKLAALVVLAFASGLNILVGLAYVVTACLAERWHQM